MNKYLMLSAAAATLAVPGAGTTATYPKTVTIGSGSSCGWVITEVQKGVYADRELGFGGTLIGTGQGLSRKTTSGRALELTENYFGSARSLGISIDFSLPFKNGGTWATWIEFSGVSAFMGVPEPTACAPLRKLAATKLEAAFGLRPGRSSQD